jgi:hypothetical protein
VGSVNLPLTTTVGDVSYRLDKAVFTITGPALGGSPRVIKPPADEPVHNEVLPVGAYSIQLEKGWVLEKRGLNEKAFSPVAASLVTPNPTEFFVNGKVIADAFFGFATTNGDVSLGKGSVNVRIGVQDCSAYDTYTAALGALTADCLGHVSPDDYKISKDGLLTPAFDSCPNDETRLRPILQLLSLQQRTARLPFVKECVAGRFEVYQAKFAASGVTSCPTWKKEGVINPITPRTISQVLDGLPQLPAADDGRPLAVLPLLKENSIYSLAFEANPVGQKCETPAACGAICAGAFPGFVVKGLSGNTVQTDPPAWLLDTTYQASTSDPYLRATYYHPMSYYGGVPGVQFGEFARFSPCNDPTLCAPEFCSYYAGSHIKTPLQRDCLNDADLDTCVSYCGPKLP